jgi:hypothetical protein
MAKAAFTPSAIPSAVLVNFSSHGRSPGILPHHPQGFAGDAGGVPGQHRSDVRAPHGHLRRTRQRPPLPCEPRRGKLRVATATRRSPTQDAVPPPAPRGPCLLDPALAQLVAVEGCPGRREARDRDRLASPWLREVLDMEVAANRSAADQTRPRRAHRANGDREPALESASHRDGASDARAPRGQEIPSLVTCRNELEAPSPAIANLGQLPPQPPRWHSFRR